MPFLTPAGPCQGIDWRFSLPIPSSREGRRDGEAMRAFCGGGLLAVNSALVVRGESFADCDCTGAIGSPRFHELHPQTGILFGA